MIWETPGDRELPLALGEVHVWRTATDVPEARLRAFVPLLAEDELERARRLRAARDRRRFIARRAFLRLTLARYVEEDPARLCFHRARGARPVLSGARGGAPPAFSAASSGDLALCAVAADGALGIDVERTAPALDWMRIARRFFAGREIATLERLPPAAGRAAFLVMWTCKEACAKASGDGLALPLDRLEVDGGPTAPSYVHDTAHAPARLWPVRRFVPAPGYAGALVTASACRAVRYYECLDVRCARERRRETCTGVDVVRVCDAPGIRAL